MTNKTTSAIDLLALAEKLTAAGKAELLKLDEHPQDKTIRWSVRYGYRFERMGLAKRTLLSDRTYLTPLGLAVRASLENGQ